MVPAKSHSINFLQPDQSGRQVTENPVFKEADHSSWRVLSRFLVEWVARCGRHFYRFAWEGWNASRLNAAREAYPLFLSTE